MNRILSEEHEAPNAMRFDVYGRFELEVIREDVSWAVYRRHEGRRQPMPDIVIPPSLDAAAIPRFLDDLLHELARPGQAIRRVD